MKVFIFGAGASSGAQNQQTYTKDHAATAPLVDGIFDEKYADIASEAGIELGKLELESKASGSVERYLAQRWENISTLQPLQQEAERRLYGKLTHYCWRILSEVSSTFPDAQGYSPLLRKLHEKNEDYALVTFNYDTLLDQSVADVSGQPLTHLADYGAARLFKLHGSVNWYLPARQGEAAPLGHSFYPEILIRQTTGRMYTGGALNIQAMQVVDPMLRISKYQEVAQLHGNRHFFPLLFIPMAGKLYESVQDFSKKMIEPAEEHIRQASEIFLIGYSAKDQLIFELLRQAPKGTLLHVIGRESSPAISSTVLGRNPNLAPGNVSLDGFESFVNSY